MRSDIDEESLAVASHIVESHVCWELKPKKGCRGKNMEFSLCFLHLRRDECLIVGDVEEFLPVPPPTWIISSF
jgi:hypothetical protein